jgi:phosphoenolpyruvate carboxykinase (ATP)
LSYTRSIIDCINNGSLLAETFVKCPRFGFDIPVHCAGVPDALLQPWLTWSDRAAYDTQLLRLTEMFNVNFSQFADKCTEAIRCVRAPHCITCCNTAPRASHCPSELPVPRSTAT